MTSSRVEGSGGGGLFGGAGVVDSCACGGLSLGRGGVGNDGLLSTGAAAVSAAGAGARMRNTEPQFGHCTAPIAWAESVTFSLAEQDGQVATRSGIRTPSRVNSRVFPLAIL